ncbi:mCG145348, partial [Mus musculus]
ALIEVVDLPRQKTYRRREKSVPGGRGRRDSSSRPAWTPSNRANPDKFVGSCLKNQKVSKKSGDATQREDAGLARMKP